MADKERKTHLLDINLGGLFEPRAAVLEELRKRGISASPRTISQLRGGHHSGNEIAYKLVLVDRLRTNNVSKKDELYLEIATIGATYENYNSKYPHRLASQGFIENTAESFHISRQALLRLLRAMRVDLIYAEIEGYDPQISNLFCETAERFLKDFTTPTNNDTSKVVITVNEQWNRRTILDFYKFFYSTGTNNIIGILPAYEVKTFRAFYQHQNNKSHSLTPFDRLALITYLEGRVEQSLLAEIRGRTGVKFDKFVLYDHRNTLAYGLPVKPI